MKLSTLLEVCKKLVYLGLFAYFISRVFESVGKLRERKVRLESKL